MSRLPVLGSCEIEPGLDAEAYADSDSTDPIPLGARGPKGIPGWLSDLQGRSLKYLRLSVTDRCDLRCVYCMPVEGVAASPRADVLSLEELAAIVRVFAKIGVQTVRLTGGEPLVRRGIADLVRMIRDDAGVADIAMTTNATALAPLAKDLASAGLRRLNVSVDSVRPDVFREMTRGGDLARVEAGIEAARAAGIPSIKTNTVVVRGQNDDQLAEIVEWAWARDLVPRFIELMPLGEGAKLGVARVVTVQEMKARLAGLIEPDASADHSRPDRGPAVYCDATGDTKRTVGFIGAVTENFCARCNRVRVTARGDLRACLASPDGLALKELLRTGQGDDAIVQRIKDALYGKRDGHQFTVDGATAHHEVAMSGIGG